MISFVAIRRFFACLTLVAAIARAEAPVVRIVPWSPLDSAHPHETYAYRTVTLKGTSSEQGKHLQATWEFGDGSAPVEFPVEHSYDVSATHAFAGLPGTAYIARLTVKNLLTNESAFAEYPVTMREQHLEVEVNVAVDEALWYAHKALHADPARATVWNVLALERQGHLPSGSSADPYTETVTHAIGLLLSQPESSPPDPAWCEALALASSPEARAALARVGEAAVTRRRSLGFTGRQDLSSRLLALSIAGVGRPDERWVALESELRNDNTFNLDIPSLLELSQALRNHTSGGMSNPIGFLQAELMGRIDWYRAETSHGDSADGVARTLVNRQNSDGSFSGAAEATAKAALVLLPASTGNFVTNVTAQVSITHTAWVYNRISLKYTGNITITNTSAQVITGPLTLGLLSLPVGATLLNSNGTFNGDPYLSFPIASLNPDASSTEQLQFEIGTGLQMSYVPVVYAGAFPPSALAIACPANTATMNSAYSSFLTTSGGVQNYNYSIGPGSLPANLSVNPNSGAISGTPSATGPVTFTANVTDSAGGTSEEASMSCTITVSAGGQPTAAAQSVTTNENAAKTITLSGSDPNGNPLTFAIATPPASGTLGTPGSPSCSGDPSTCTATVTYTPNANTSGSDSFTFTVNNGTTTSTQATVSITVTFVNQAPGFTVGANQVVTENAGSQSVSGWATNISAGPNQSSEMVHFNITGDTNSALFSAGPAVSPTGTLTYTPAANATGAATITLDIQNSGGTANGGVDTSATQSFTITVNAAPQITSANSATFAPGKTGQTFTVTTTGVPTGASMAISAGSGFPSAVTLTNNNNGTATISGIPAAGTQNASPYSVVITANNGVTPNATQNFTLNVTCPAISVSGTASFTLAQNAAMTASTYTNTGGTTPLVWSISGQPAGLSIGSGSGQLSGTPTATGSFNATVTATDAGNCTGTKPVSITVNSNPPTASGQTVSTSENAAKIITLSGSDPNGRALTFAIASSPTIGELGTLGIPSCSGNPSTCTATVTYTPNANTSGSDSFTFTVNNGTTTSTPATVNITVSFVNQAPSFTVGANQVVTENAGPQSVSGWATNISAGPNQSSETVHFNITGDTNSALFSAGPVVSPTGALTYTPAANTTGNATITLDIQNSGGTANGGVDTSTTQSFTITVALPPQITSTNTATFAPGKTGQTFTVTTTGVPSGALMVISTGSGFPSAVTLTNNNNGTATISGTPAAGTQTASPYSVLITANNGVAPNATQNFTLNVTCPAISVSGSATLNLTGGVAMTESTYTQTGGNGTIVWSATSLPSGLSIGSSNGQVSGAPTSGGSFSATITATDAGNCTGTKAVTVNVAPVATNDTYPQTVIGNVSVSSALIPYSVTSNDLGGPFTISTFNATSANGGTVSMTTSGANIGQFSYTPAAGFTGADSFTYTISNAGGSSTATVNLTVSGIIWFINNNGTSGDGRLATPFNTLAAFQAINDGVGRHPAANANIFLYDSGTAYTGPVTLLSGQKLIGQDATSSLATVAGLTPGTSSATLPTTGGGSPNKVQVTSSGNSVTLNSGNTVWGLTLGNATGTALTGSSVGSLEIRDLTISTTGAAANLANGSLNAIFNSISSGGGANGIALSTTTGSFDVEGGGPSDPTNTTKGRTTAKSGGGTLTLGSGGTIQDATGVGVLLSNATNVTLRNMVIQNNAGHGINASGSSSVTLDNTLITGQTNNAGLYASALNGLAIQHTQISSNATSSSVGSNLWNVTLGEPPCNSSCTDGLSGTATVANSIFDTAFQNSFGMVNHNASTVSLTVTNSQFSNGGNDGLQALAWDTANVSINVSGSNTFNNPGGGVEYLGQGSSGGGTFTVTGSTFEQNGSSGGADINVFHEGLGKTVTFDFENNTTRQSFVSGSSASISVDLGGQANSATVLQGKIIDNTVGIASVTDSGSALSSGIAIGTNAPGTITTLVTGNTVKQTDDDALLVLASSESTSTINITASGNDFEVSPTDPNTNLGLELTSGGSGGSDVICANISGNSKEVGNSGVAGIATTVFSTAVIELQGYTGSANNNNQIATFLNATATTVSPAALNFGGGGTVKAAPSSCPSVQ